MKRHLNTSYRLVWNHITGTLVVASELARSRGKRAGVAVALSLAAVTSVPALAADTVVQAGETVNDGTLTNHDNQIVLGTANGMTISTGLEYGPDNRAEMSPEAAGIAACLMTYSHHACRTECYAMTVHYYRLRDYALQHPECSAIMRIID
ncbi:antirestriction protein [Escherichia coli]|uniref:antirestriction protein n=1 Tax=Escherichia coli TaxID=562 RepID=UPI001B0B845D|nr:adhesin [Escherichia coli]